MIAAFWRWVQSQPALAAWPPDRALAEALGDQLRTIHEELAFEMTRRNSSTELAISAAGDAELFELVREIVAAAPRLPLSVVAFRQRGKVESAELKFRNGRILSSNDIWFALERDDQGLGLHVFVRDLPDEEPGPLQNAVYLLLDNALGELDVVTNVAWIAWAPLPPAPEAEGLAPLTQLPHAFDAAMGR